MSDVQVQHDHRSSVAGPPERDLRYRWIGGTPCLDFVNTVGWEVGPPDQESQIPRPQFERFTSYARLVDWSVQAGTLSEREGAVLLQEVERRPEEAVLALERALALRLAIHRIFAAAVHHLSIDRGSLALFNGVLSEALSRLRIETTAEGFVWRWAGGETALERPLWPVVQSAADLLTEGELGRVRECLGEGCGFLFVDRSRPGTRRWCDMADCGNRAKARRHYARGHIGHAS